MKRDRFPLSSEQLELLLAFGEKEGLRQLAETLGKDPSVVSRGLQRIAEDFPVLVKVKGRWELTPLGREINQLTKETIDRYANIFRPVTQLQGKKKLSFSQKSILVIINAQVGLLDSTQLGRNNSDAEKNLSELLKYWRTRKMPVIHVRHVSDNPGSFFFRNSPGCEFLPEATPKNGEKVIDKTKSSAFSGTTLEEALVSVDPDQLVFAGFTANECIDATARDASALGFSAIVVEDATAMFDLRGPDGKLIKAERLQKLTIANLSAFYATIVQTKDIVLS